MVMHNAESMLVIIVSAVLAVFLVVAIVVLVLVARLVAAAKRAIGKAEHVMDSAEAATEIIKNAGGPLAILKIVRNVMRMTQKFRK